MEAVAVFVVEAALSAAFDALFGKLSSQEVLKYARRNNVESEINQWSKLLDKIKYVLVDAEEREVREGPIKIWLDDLRNLTYDVEDILDEFSFEALRQNVMAETKASTSKVRKLIHTSYSCFSPRDIMFNESMGSKMKEITQRFESITKEKDDLRLTERATGESNRVATARDTLETSSLVQESQVYGRDKEKETLVNELLRSDWIGKPISVVAIVGMGGLGKTTLAQLAYRDERICRSFDIKAWVCVSDEFDVFKITVKIIEDLTKSPCNIKGLNSVQEELQYVLGGKKLLLVLDDVWNEDYLKWDALSQPLAACGFGSKVLITTRTTKVASTAGAGSMHRLRTLGLEECTSLLALHAFGVDSFSGHPWLQEVGRKIANKCDGLPLAVKAIGGLLRGQFDPREWQRVLDSNTWELSRDNCHILPALFVSYRYLPSHLKRCFAYCAIFPKDYTFHKNELILWWMAEGFLEQSKHVISNFEEVGNGYFKDLLSRSFFQPFTENEDSKFVIHDLMHDLAIWVSGGMYLHVNSYEESTSSDFKFENLRHLSFMGYGSKFARRFENFPLPTRLRTLIALFLCDYVLSNVILHRVVPKMKYLRILCLSHCFVIELPHTISELKHLRRLDMSFTNIRLLPDSTCDLLNLQVLKLNCCWFLVQLPREIRKLINLQFLDISNTDKLKLMPSGIGCLKNLQILSKFIVGEKHELRLNELKGLSHLRGELFIGGLEKVVDVQEARDANLKAKEGLLSLEFKWKWMEETSVVEKEKQFQIFDELEPHASLKGLKIDGYNGKHFPKWVGDCRFTNLATVSLRGCKSVSSLPALVGLISLKILEIAGMDEVKKLGKEFLGNTSNSNNTFPSLETLILKEMNELEEWCSDFGSGAEIVFPRLQKMEIRDCPVLVGKLPHQLPCLQELLISGCPNLRNLECRHPSLHTLAVEDCSEAAIKTLGDLTSLRSLKLANIGEMICMEDELLSMLGSLQELKIEKCRKLKSLVRNGREIERMAGLERLMIESCDELVSFGPMRLPSSLKQMDISRCNALEWLPEGLMMDGSSSCESALAKLNIAECPALATFPRGRFPYLLVDLCILRCHNLKSIPEFSTSIKYVAIDQCNHLQSWPRFPTSVVSLRVGNLKSLASQSTAAVKPMSIYSNSKNVQHQSSTREVGNVEDLESESEKMFGDCSCSLESLIISGFNLRRLPTNITSLQRIKQIQIYRCQDLRWLPDQMQELNCLRELKVIQCPNLELLEGQNLPGELDFLHIMECERVIQGLFAGGMSSLSSSLTRLHIDAAGRDIDIKQVAPVYLPKLKHFWMINFGNLKNLGAAFQLSSSIETLTIDKCAKLQELPILELSSSLGYLCMSSCPWLKKRCLDRRRGYWPLLSTIPLVQIDGDDYSGSRVPAKRVGLFDGCI